MKKVSIIMGIYNCESTLEKSIDSLLGQTYSNWELIMCDDGSQDRTYEIAKKYADTYLNIILVRNETNKGLNYTLNHCLKYATGTYIARQDGDDISLPTRLEKEVEILNNNPQYALVSSAMIYFDEQGEWGQGKPVEKPGKSDFISGSPFCHAPCMIREEVIREVGGYSESKWLLRVEDYHLWLKIYERGYRGINIKEPLYKMRDDQNAYKRRKYKYRINEFNVRLLAASKLGLGIKGYIYALRPLIVGLLPKKIYLYLHKRRL